MRTACARIDRCRRIAFHKRGTIVGRAEDAVGARRLHDDLREAVRRP